MQSGGPFYQRKKRVVDGDKRGGVLYLEFYFWRWIKGTSDRQSLPNSFLWKKKKQLTSCQKFID